MRSVIEMIGREESWFRGLVTTAPSDGGTMPIRGLTTSAPSDGGIGNPHTTNRHKMIPIKRWFGRLFE